MSSLWSVDRCGIRSLSYNYAPAQLTTIGRAEGGRTERVRGGGGEGGEKARQGRKCKDPSPRRLAVSGVVIAITHFGRVGRCCCGVSPIKRQHGVAYTTLRFAYSLDHHSGAETPGAKFFTFFLSLVYPTVYVAFWSLPG